MNIAVAKASGGYCFRPDSTLNREACDYYLPDGIEAVTLTPCIYSKVSRASKCVGERFASRHIDNFGFGVLLDAVGAAPQEACCMDASSYLSGDTLPFAEIGNASFEISVNGESWFREDDFEAGILYNALVGITRRSSLRASDLLAVCLPASVTLRAGDYFCFAGRKVSIL